MSSIVFVVWGFLTKARETKIRERNQNGTTAT